MQAGWGAHLHEGTGVHQAGQLTHDGHMLAGIPLGRTELTEVLHKILQCHALHIIKLNRHSCHPFLARAMPLCNSVICGWLGM